VEQTSFRIREVEQNGDVDAQSPPSLAAE